MAKKTAVSNDVVLTEEFLMRLEQDAQFLEQYLLNDMAGYGDFTANSTVNYVEELLSMMPEELAPLAIVLRRVRAIQVARSV